MKAKAITSALAAASALFAASTAHAAIGSNYATQGSAEMFIVVFDENQSYAMDTGLDLNSFLTSTRPLGSSMSVTLGPLFNNYKALDTNLFDGTDHSGTRWLLAGVNNIPSDLHGQATAHIVSSVTSDAASLANPAAFHVRSLSNAGNTLSSKLASISATGTHAGGLAVNGESINTAGSAGYWDAGSNSVIGKTFGNAVGQDSRLYESSLIYFDFATRGEYATPFQSIVSFNGTTLTVTTPVPEPEGLVLLVVGFAGLAAARRRQQQR